MLRRDAKNIDVVGAAMLKRYKSIVSTGRTEEEDYYTDLSLSTSAETMQIEVKTIRDGKRPFPSKNIKVSSPSVWDKDFWMLNYDSKSGESKWEKMLSHKYKGIIFYREKEGELILFNRQELIDAVIGTASLFQKHTTDLKDKSIGWEKKVLIDLDKGRKIRIDG